MNYITYRLGESSDGTRCWIMISHRLQFRQETRPMIVTPETGRVGDVERGIRPPLAFAATIPLSIDGRHSMHDGYVVYVGIGAFTNAPPREARRLTAAIAKAIGEHLKTMPPVNIDT